MGRREVYAEMLSDTFDLTVAYSKSSGPNSNSRLICEPCIARLRDAADFKRQVQECERTFLQHLDPSASDIVLEVTAEPLEKAVKMEDCEPVKEENVPSDDDIDDVPDFGDDDDDDLDDQPLTRLASKTPKKETMDISDLLDNAKAAEKRKSSTKTKTSPAKKAKTKKDKVIAKPKPEKKKKGTEANGRQGALTSIWEMTLSERQNAAMFLEFTTARPFMYCRYFFKCFFCREQFSEISALLKHSLAHEMPDGTKILKELLPKGKRTVKVDISELKCKICEQNFADIDTIRKHLISEHKKLFTASGNGIVAYNLTTKDGQFACHICDKIFQTFILLNRHMNVHFNNAVCETCGAGFMTHQRLLKHKEIHQPGGYPCNQCGKVYTTNSNLKYHVEKTHEGSTNMRMLRCPHCLERFTEHFRKLKHLKDVHGITFTFQCDVCKSTFPTRRALTMHTNKFHTQKTQCEICKKTFSCVSTLKKHKVSHTGERNFVCRLCHKTYRHQKSLKQHMRIHIADECNRFVCTECGSVFSSQIEFNKHVKEWHQKCFFNFVN